MVGGKSTLPETNFPLDITERKQAEEALRESEILFRQTFDVSPIGIVLVGLDKRFIRCNLAFSQSLGYGTEELVGKLIEDVTLPEDKLIGMAEMMAIMKGETTKSQVHKRYLRKDGQVIWGEVTISLIRDSEGRAQYFLAIIQDITERKQAEEALRESKEYAENLIDTANTMVIGLDLNGKITVLNQAAEAITGYTRSELLDRNWFDFIAPKDRYPQVWAEFDGPPSGVFPKNFENPIQTKTGEERYIVWQNSQVFEKGKVVGTISFGMDITERKQAEQTQARLVAMLDATPGFVGFADARDDHILYINSAGRKMVGVQPDEDVTRLKIADVHPEWTNKLLRSEGIPTAIRDGRWTGECAFLNRDGREVPVMMALLAHKSPNGEVEQFSAVSIDITERKDAVEALLKSVELLFLFIKHSPIYAFIKEVTPTESRVLHASENYQDLVGLPGQEIVGKAMDELFPAEFAAKITADDWDVITKGEVLRLEEQLNDRIYTTIKFPIVQSGKTLLAGYTIDITERKQAEVTLRESEERFRSILENIEDGYYEVDTTGNLTFFNPAYVRILARTPNELMGMNNRLYMTPPGAKAVFQIFNRVFRTGIAEQDIGFEMVRPDGTLRSVEISASLIKDAHGSILGFRGTVRDITERKQAEDTLRESEQRFRSLFKNMLSGFAYCKMIFDQEHPQDFIYLDVNRAFETLTGLKDVVGKKVTEIIPGIREADPELFETYGRVALTGKPETFEIFIASLGVWHSVSLYSPQKGYFVSVFDVITERKQAEKLQDALYRIAQAADLSESLDALYPAIHAIVKEVMAADTFYIALYDENRDTLSFPYSVDEVDLLIPPEKPGKSLTAHVIRTAKSLLCDEALFEDLKQRGEVELIGATSEIWLGVPMLVEGKAIGVIVVQDYKNAGAYGEREQHILEFVSSQAAIAIHRKRAEEEILQLNAELEKRVEERTRDLTNAQEKLVRQEKLATLGEIAGSVSHELRNPLGVISNAVYFLKLVQPDADEKIRKYHAMIEKETNNAEKIIADLLDFARLKSMERELVSVPALVQSALSRYPVPASVKVALKLPPDLPMVFADPRQMEQVLGNLVMNAYQAMAPRSSAAGVSRGARLTISASVEKEMVAIAVKDNGVGIPPENMAKLFEPLFTTKSKGIGLGLPISQKLAETNGGRIQVESQPGKGSTFTLVLPVQEDKR